MILYVRTFYRLPQRIKEADKEAEQKYSLSWRQWRHVHVRTMTILANMTVFNDCSCFIEVLKWAVATHSDGFLEHNAFGQHRLPIRHPCLW